MKILHVGKYYPPRRGGMETVLRDLAEGCLEAGCEVRVITAGEGPVATRHPLGGRPEARLTRLAVPAVVNSQPVTPGLAAALRREIRDFAPDLVHLHLPNPLAALTWLALEAWPGMELPPLLVWYHADITRQRLGRSLLAPLVRGILARAAGVSVSSEGLRASSAHLARLGDRVRVIPFGIDPRPWIDVRPARNGPFLFVGRLVRYKGLATLLEALRILPEAELVVVGEGPREGALRKAARQPGLAGRVRFAGSLDRRALAEEMATARALVLPSVDRSETFGLVQLEAMAAGLAVIVSDLETGVARVGEPGTTCLAVPPRDAGALARAMDELRSDPDRVRDLGEAGRRLFLARYTRDPMIAALLAWYREILGAEVLR